MTRMGPTNFFIIAIFLRVFSLVQEFKSLIHSFEIFNQPKGTINFFNRCANLKFFIANSNS